jgi:3-methyladenine DNA glycosylase AlkC
MSALLKDIYSEDFYRAFGGQLKSVLPKFSPAKFINQIFTTDWEQKELKDRMRHTADVLHRHLPADFRQAAPLLDQLSTQLSGFRFTSGSLALMFLPDYVERYGIDHYDSAVPLFEKITPITSCEFAVRPFLIRYPEKMLLQMIRWSSHTNHHVRRLASEGSRPRLPWAIALPAYKKDPRPVLPLLENLRNDPSEYVRRSVANHLNDIAKDNPAIVLEVARSWKGVSPETDALIKHACRTLLKKGDPGILSLHGLDARQLEVDGIKHRRKLEMGESLNFSFTVRNKSKKPVLARLEYALYFLRQNGQYGKKVFKISEKTLPGATAIEVSRSHAFRPITTRVYYTGIQRLSIIVNGRETAPVDFRLNC